MAQARLNVQDGGTLSGVGTIGATQITQGGIIAPGNDGAIGTLTVNQNLTMARGTLFRAKGNGQSSGTTITDGGKTYSGLNSDRIQAAGNVSLNGRMVNFNVARRTVLKARNAYTILEATGSLSGQFDRLESNISEQYLFLKPSLFMRATSLVSSLMAAASALPRSAARKTESRSAAHWINCLKPTRLRSL
ncbi:MAG: hypothetical protein AAYR33_08025 [Acetobacteraceae bacterium]